MAQPQIPWAIAADLDSLRMAVAALIQAYDAEETTDQIDPLMAALIHAYQRHDGNVSDEGTIGDLMERRHRLKVDTDARYSALKTLDARIRERMEEERTDSAKTAWGTAIRYEAHDMPDEAEVVGWLKKAFPSLVTERPIHNWVAALRSRKWDFSGDKFVSSDGEVAPVHVSVEPRFRVAPPPKVTREVVE